MREVSGLTVSVALCTRDGQRHIADQINSIIHQSVPPAQIVLSDDDSSDDTVATALALLALRPDIAVTVLRNSPPLGLVGNFNQAVLACSGNLIALCDQDDVWAEDRLETVINRFESDTGLTLLSSNAVLIDGDGKPLPHTLFDALEITEGERADLHEGRAFDALLRRNLITGATTVFRRDLITVASPFPAHWIHDEWLAMIASAVGRIDADERRLVFYRQHEGNMIGAARPTFNEKLSRLREPRRARNQRLLNCANELVQRLDESPSASTTVQGSARAKLSHEQMRSSLPRRRLARVAPIVAAALRGHYRRYSRGWQDVLRDLVQPD